MLAGIVWDFDGTLVDTETPQFEAWAQVFEEAGGELRPSDWGQIVGTLDGINLLDVLESQAGRLDRPKTLRRLAELTEKYLDQAPLRPGVRDLLAELGELSIPCAIASSSHRQWIVEFLRDHGILHYFTAIAAADDVARVKPDPSVYRVALRRLRVPAAQALAIEDSPHGAAAALGAGLVCVVVPNPSTKALSFPVAVRRLTTLENVGVRDLEKLMDAP